MRYGQPFVPSPPPPPPPPLFSLCVMQILIRFMQKANLCLVWRKTQINDLVMENIGKGKWN